eukprot:14741359-Ditylum_brightwellii.AAC.1
MARMTMVSSRYWHSMESVITVATMVTKQLSAQNQSKRKRKEARAKILIENAMGVVSWVTGGLTAGRMRRMQTKAQHGSRSHMRLGWWPVEVVATKLLVEQSTCLWQNQSLS